MESYQTRVVEERKELNIKIEKLDVFFERDKFKSLDSYDRFLLFSQSLKMKHYLEILDCRIERF